MKGYLLRQKPPTWWCRVSLYIQAADTDHAHALTGPVIRALIDKLCADHGIEYKNLTVEETVIPYVEPPAEE